MNRIDVKLDATALAELSKKMKIVKENVLKEVSASMDSAAGLVANTWREWATGDVALPDVGGIEKPSPEIARSIKIDKTGSWQQVISSDSEEMAKIQRGTPAVNVEYDMKKTHPYGPKSRVTQSGKNKGTPYLIVRFRWGTPSAKDKGRAHIANYIPQVVYNTGIKVSKLNISRILETTHTEKNYKGEDVERWEYQWGGRVTPKQAWDKNAAGMVRMANRGGYYTFRIISAKSPAGSWIYRRNIPGKPALDVTGALVKATESTVNAIVQEGFESAFK